ncbi:MAG: hypothetical protein N2B02_05370, partial [Amylibacter sp.]
MTINEQEITPIIREAIGIAVVAGNRIKEIYHQTEPVVCRTKKDTSPVTEADLASHDLIQTALRQLTPEIPIISEEGDQGAWANRAAWPTLWLIDPLDGTQEFLHRTDEFTVNMGVVCNHQPVGGVVYVPMTGEVYWAAKGQGAYWRASPDAKDEPI